MKSLIAYYVPDVAAERRVVLYSALKIQAAIPLCYWCSALKAKDLVNNHVGIPFREIKVYTYIKMHHLKKCGSQSSFECLFLELCN